MIKHTGTNVTSKSLNVNANSSRRQQDLNEMEGVYEFGLDWDKYGYLFLFSKKFLCLNRIYGGGSKNPDFCRTSVMDGP